MLYITNLTRIYIDKEKGKKKNITKERVPWVLAYPKELSHDNYVDEVHQGIGE